MIQWAPYIVQSVLVLSMLFIAAFSIFSDLRYSRKVLLITGIFVGAFALYQALILDDYVAGIFFGIISIISILVGKLRRINLNILRSVLVTELLILATIIVKFGIFKYFDFKNPLNIPPSGIDLFFKFNINGYVVWILFVIISAFLCSRYFKKSPNVGSESKINCVSSVILGFWILMTLVRMSQPQFLPSTFTLDNITMNIFLGDGANARGKYGYTRLHAAIEKGDIIAVKELTKEGADVNKLIRKGKYGLYLSPLIMSVSKNYDIFTHLIENGARLNDIDPNGFSVLNHFDFKENKYREYLIFMIRNGVDLSKKSPSGKQLIHNLANSYDKRYIANNLDSIEILIDNGVDVNAIANNGSTPLHQAIVGGNFEAIKKLVELGADLTIKDKYNRTPPEYAKQVTQRRHSGVVRPNPLKGIEDSMVRIETLIVPYFESLEAEYQVK